MSRRSGPNARLGHFIERLAVAFDDAGIPRMPARVLALLISSDGPLTSTEIAERLQISAAAVSGGVRYLIQVRLISKQRLPGTRRDSYQMTNDTWYEAILQRESLIDEWAVLMREGEQLVTPGGNAQETLAESALFMEFLRDEMPQVLDRWRAYRDSHAALVRSEDAK